MSVPYWLKDAVFYQIFPDRFENGDALNDPPNRQVWGTLPTTKGFQGGDLRGIIHRMDYLLDLGINAIYLNPIFQSASTHRYDTVDYYRIDPKLGALRDFQALLDAAHRNNIRVILDGVFNHCGRGFFAFNDVLENQNDSPYRDWFYIQKFPIDAYQEEKATYKSWWNIKSLPKFNTDNPDVRQYIFNIARYWVDQGIDGWRLDVPNEIDDDAFWAEFRHTVKTANPDACLIGEIWDSSPRWIGDDHFDSLMNYPLRKVIYYFLRGDLKPSDLIKEMDRLMRTYPKENVFAMYNLLGSHDVERIATKLGENYQRVKAAFGLLFALPGAPAIYYGDEVGLLGGKDPDCRRAFPWEKNLWKMDVYEWIKSLISLRKKESLLRRGDFVPVKWDDERLYSIFSRKLGDEQMIIVCNGSADNTTIYLATKEIGLKSGQRLNNVLGEESFVVDNEGLALQAAPYQCLWLKMA
jgi:glycosidase